VHRSLHETKIRSSFVLGLDSLRMKASPLIHSPAIEKMCSSNSTVYAQHGLDFHVYIASTFKVLNYDCISPAPVPPTIALLHHKWLKGTPKLLGTKQPYKKSHFQRRLEDESCPPLAGTVISKKVLVQTSSCVLYD